MQARDKFFSSLRALQEAATLSPPKTAGSVGVIDVGERLDSRAAERLKIEFKKFVAEGRSRHIIDLSRLDDLDSSGLAQLISALRAVREAGGSVHLVAKSSRVTRILELTALSRLFRVHASLQAALASM